MTRTWKDRLNEYRERTRRARMLELQVEYMREKGIDPAEIAAAERECRLERTACAAARFEVAAIIERVHNPRLREVLEARYIKLMEWQQVADSMSYEKRWVMRLHKRALEEL